MELHKAFNGLAAEGVNSPIAALAQRYSNSLPDIVRQAGAQGGHVLFGDTDHRSLSIVQSVSRPEVLKALAENGISKMFIERPQELQNLSDSLAFGTMGRDSFVDYMDSSMSMFHVDRQDARAFHEATADLIVNAKSFGIDVYFADPGIAGQKAYPDEILQASDLVARRYMDENGLLLVGDLYAHLSDPDNHAAFQEYAGKNVIAVVGEDRFHELMDQWLTETRLDDAALAEFINEKSGGAPVAVLYGSAHLQTENGLDELMDGPSIRIDLYDGTEIYGTHAQNPAGWQQDPPDIIFRVDTGEAFGTPDMHPELAQGLSEAAAPTQSASTRSWHNDFLFGR